MFTLPARRFTHAPSQRAFFALIALMSVLALLLAGCAFFASSSKASTDAQLEDRQVLRMPLNANSTDINTMDPATLGDYNSYVPVQLVFPGLLTLDAHGNTIPWAATEMPAFDATKNTYTFKVRNGLKWSDGTPIDANNFAYSINRSLNPCTKSPVTYYLYPVKDAAAFSTQGCGLDGKTIQGKIASLIGDSLLVPDPQTLVIQLTAPASYFLQAMTYPTAAAQPQQLIEKYGDTNWNTNWTKHLTDNGGFSGNLYRVKLWDHRGNLVLVRNNGFWGAKPKLSEIDFHIYKTDTAEYNDFLSGKLDIGLPPLEQYQYQQAKHRADFHELPILSIVYFQPNWQLPPFNDLRVRQAFAFALNKVALAADLQGAVIPTNHIVPQGMSGYNPNLVGPDGTTNLTGNLPLAQQLMQSYAHDMCDGKLNKCPVFKIPAPCYTAITFAEEQLVLQTWRQAFPGYPIYDSVGQWSCSPTGPLAYLTSSPFFSNAWIADYPDPQDWLSLQFSPNATWLQWQEFIGLTISPIANFGNVNVPAANTLMTAADTNLNPDIRAALYQQAEQLLVNQVAWIPLYQQQFSYNQPTYVHNLNFTNLGLIPLSSWQQITIYSH